MFKITRTNKAVFGDEKFNTGYRNRYGEIYNEKELTTEQKIKIENFKKNAFTNSAVLTMTENGISVVLVQTTAVLPRSTALVRRMAVL